MDPGITRQIERVQQLIAGDDLAQAAAQCDALQAQAAHLPVISHLSGVIALRQGRYQDALALYRQLLTRAPDKPEYLYNCGIACLHAGDFPQAVARLRRVTELAPALATAWSDLCLAYWKEGEDIEAAVQAGRRAVSLQPGSGSAHYNLALALESWRDLEASLEHFLEADRLSPGHIKIDFDLGNVYIELGQTEKARERFRAVIARQPHEVSAYTNLCRITRYETTGHDDVRQLQRLLEEDWLTPDQRANVFFALGKVYQDCAQYDEAFAFFREGNRVRDELFRFDPDEHTAFVRSLQQHYTRELLEEKSACGLASDTPVFIVGTPRSGTTLVEQIVSSHPDVFGAGELEWVGKAASALPSVVGRGPDYPDCVQHLSASHIRTLAAKYLDYLHALADGQPRITDKLPGNFLHLGLIHILFPNARIIHCVRDPLDACVSMFTQYFTDGVRYSYNLDKLARYYRDYRSLMAHWKSVLPEGVIFEVVYEELVEDQAAVSRRIIESLGLDWHEDCLEFYRQKRRVHTASDLQVRRPVYRSSIGRWRHYEKFLGPLREGLGII